MHVHLHLNANDLFTQNYTELYIHHDGTDTYVADYYFDSDSSKDLVVMIFQTLMQVLLQKENLDYHIQTHLLFQ